MADQGTHQTRTGTPYFHESGSFWTPPFVSTDWGEHLWLKKVCGTGGGEDEYVLMVLPILHPHVVSAPDLIYTVTFDVETIEHQNTTQVSSFLTIPEGLVPGPPPSGYDVLEVLKIHRNTLSDLGPSSELFKELPELIDLRTMFDTQTLQKMQNYTRFEVWVSALITSYLEGSVRYDAYRAKDKEWARFNSNLIQEVLRKKYDPQVAKNLATALAEWAQKFELDEEDNFLTIERWSDLIRPVESF